MGSQSRSTSLAQQIHDNRMVYDTEQLRQSLSALARNTLEGQERCSELFMVKEEGYGVLAWR